jgi:hypothetical protein
MTSAQNSWPTPEVSFCRSGLLSLPVESCSALVMLAA